MLAFSATIALWVLPGVFSWALGDAHAVTRRFAVLVPESIAAIVRALAASRDADQLARASIHAVVGRGPRIDCGNRLLFGGGSQWGLSELTGPPRQRSGRASRRVFPDAGSMV